ncbi:MAG: CaiB/BaiF CoA transferase family protein [Sporichthyaceae bacterium]
MTGPLTGLRVVELGGIGPGPHGAMMLADLGADVVRIERRDGGLQLVPPGTLDWVLRNRRIVAADLKDGDDLAAILQMCDRADVLIEGFRPGVTERLGLGPDDLLARNPRLVYAPMTGWGQDGPLAQRAGHDLNYIGLTGALSAFRAEPDGPPVPPVNLLGDFGGGSMLLVQGILAALYERGASGRGQVVDAAIVDGVSTLAQMMWAFMAVGTWRDRPASNLLDTGAPFYSTYRCSDGGYVAVGSLEPQFYAALLAGLDLTDADLPAQTDPRGWPILRERFAELFASRTRDEWAAVFADTDACVTPVLSWGEAAEHPHLAERGTIAEFDGVRQAAPSPRFSRTVPDSPTAPPTARLSPADVLSHWLP